MKKALKLLWRELCKQACILRDGLSVKVLYEGKLMSLLSTPNTYEYIHGFEHVFVIVF